MSVKQNNALVFFLYFAVLAFMAYLLWSAYQSFTLGQFVGLAFIFGAMLPIITAIANSCWKERYINPYTGLVERDPY